MSIKAGQPLISPDRIQQLLQIEPALLITALALGAFVIYRLFLGDLSAERHQNLRKLFVNVGYHLLAMAILFIVYLVAQHHDENLQAIERLGSYVGLLTLIQECIAAIKTARIFIFEYLYLSHMRVAFPLLLVNLFTLLLTVIASGWLMSTIFAIQIAPLVATSAVFSLVLGLALQDTIGNLFAGVALQFDKPYEINDWIEVQASGNRWVGQVHEISWRATVLHAMTDETFTIPNKIMSQAQISNFSAKKRPFVRSQAFRLPFEAPSELVRQILLDSVSEIPGIRKDLRPLVLITEAGEAWVNYKVIYYLQDFGTQYIVGDRVLDSVLRNFKKHNLALAHPRMTVIGTHVN